MYYFELFETPVSLLSDKAEILQKYYALSREYHPDNFSLQDKVAQENSLAISAKINEAKMILEDSHKRLAYILKEKNIIEADEKYPLSPAFLGEMMDINEQLMDLEMEDNAETKAAIKIEVQNKEKELYDGVRSFFEMPVLDISDEDYQRLKEYYYKRKYIERVLEKV